MDSSGYLVRGDRSSSAVGARLWNLDGIRRDWQKSGSSSSDSCADQIFKQAVDDQAEYWKSIGKKYHCDKQSSGENEGPCASFSQNSTYLGFVSSALAGFNKLSKGGPCVKVSDPAPQAHSLARDMVAAVSAALSPHDDASCRNVPADIRRKPDEKMLTLSTLTLPLDCVKGMVKEVISELVSLKDFAQGWWKVGLWTGVANVVRAIKDDPIKVVSNAFIGVYQYFIGDTIENIGCYNNAAQVEKICRVLPKIGIAYLTGTVVNPAWGWALGKGAKAVKFVSSPIVTPLKKGLAPLKAGADKLLKKNPGATVTAEDAASKSGQTSTQAQGDAQAQPQNNASKQNSTSQRDSASTDDVASQTRSEGAKAPKGKPRYKLDSGGTITQIDDVPSLDPGHMEDIASQIIPESARAPKTSNWSKVKTGAKATAKAATGAKAKAMKAVRAAYLPSLLDESSRERENAPDISNALSEREKKHKEAEERWKKEHPNGEDAEYTPPSPAENDESKKSDRQLSDLIKAP